VYPTPRLADAAEDLRMQPKNPVFEITRRGYLAEIAGIDFGRIENGLAISVQADAAVVPFLGTEYRVSADAITGPDGRPAPAAVCVVLCKHLLMCPQPRPLAADWVSFRDFRDAAPLASSFANTVEGAIARGFAGHAADLARAADALGGRPPEGGFRYDVCRVIPALPRVPVLLLFNDADEDFPASCSVLYERRAERYLDMECLAMLGAMLAEGLKRNTP
jgi:hypothetical protein